MLTAFTILTYQKLIRSKKSPVKKVGFIFEKVLDLLFLMWYVVVLTGGATHEKYDKRVMARKHHSARGQQKQLEGDEGATWIHGKASQGLGKDLHAPLSQSRLTKACVRAFSHSQASPKPSQLQTPLQASISCPQRPCAPLSQSCLIKGNQATNGLKLRYTRPLSPTLDLTETSKPCSADSILPGKSEHRHSQ